MKKRIIKIILIFVIIVSFCVHVIAKYYQEIIIESKTKILKPIIQIESDEKIQINNVEKNIIEYKFCIKNYDDIQINKVNMLYKIEIINTFNNKNIYFELFDDNTNEKIEFIENKTEYIRLPIEKYDKKYKLVLNLNNEKNLNGKINIKIEVNQEKI